ncbi:hypothetical protein ACO7_220024 [Thiomonas arsenitoxydans]|nr:hypothetical protein ACO3_240023 [Thiomonas arsenitoxydans]CQR30580.1 hypothetical protein ACO7_220024 [Thiomonas arsenitoxydans]CQR32040.1 hypothetical protein THICB6_160091 [Thiomonas arsenitoxydans]
MWVMDGILLFVFDISTHSERVLMTNSSLPGRGENPFSARSMGGLMTAVCLRILRLDFAACLACCVPFWSCCSSCCLCAAGRRSA